MQDIRKKHLNSRSNYPVSREITPRSDDTAISHVGLSGTEQRRPRFTKSDDVSLYKNLRERADDEKERKDHQSEGKKWRKIKTTIFYLFILSIMFTTYYTLTYVFDKATVTITPNYKDVKLPLTPVLIGEKGVIPFTLSSTEIAKTKTLPKTMTTTVEKKAAGDITIYNNFSESSQRLVKFTRFESTAKKIYKIQESVVVPGKKGNIPGEITVRVLAESDGPSYNLDEDTFTIPGFKGKDQYLLMGAKTKASIVGGMSGSRAIVALTDLNAAKDEVAMKLRESAKSEFAAKAWGSKIPVLDSLSVVIEDNAKEVLRGESDIYSAKGVASIVTVEGSDLSKVLLTGNINKSLTYSFIRGKESTLSLDNKSSSFSSSISSTTLTLLVSGNARILWVTNYNTLKKDFVNKTKKEFTATISGDKIISSAVVSIFPPWKNSFPTQEDSILIKEKLQTYTE